MLRPPAAGGGRSRRYAWIGQSGSGATVSDAKHEWAGKHLQRVECVTCGHVGRGIYPAGTFDYQARLRHGVRPTIDPPRAQRPKSALRRKSTYLVWRRSVRVSRNELRDMSSIFVVVASREFPVTPDFF